MGRSKGGQNKEWSSEEKYNIITFIMDNHVEERHIRGGEATKRKYSCIAK